MSELEIAEKQTKVDLTSTQKRSGEYQKGEVNLRGINITIENPKGTYRSGISDGVQWKSLMNYTYGFINNSVGADGDEIDIFLGPLAESNQDFLVYIIHQNDCETGLYDEDKIMFGFNSSIEAKQAYLSCYEENWGGYGSMEQTNIPGFIIWLKERTNGVFINKLNLKNNEVMNNIHLIKLEGEVLEGQTLLDLQKQAGNLEGIETLVISIGSPGGDVEEGIKIMVWFDYLSSIGIKVVTLVVSNAYSIASLIMLAADHTIIAKDADVMVHNPMLPELKLVNANELESHIKDLRKIEATMYDLYEVFTELPREKVKELMDNETYLSASDAILLGFADEIANIEKRPKIMAKTKLKLINMKKTLNILNQVVALVSGSNIVNQSYYDDQGGGIEIQQQDPATYTAGDRTSVESGQIKLQDGSILNIKDWVIESIEKAAPVVAPVVPAAVEPVVPAVEPAPVQANFNQGPAPVVPVVEDKPVEMKTEVTKTETTKTEPVVAVAVVEPAKVEPVAVAEPVAVVEPVAVAEPAKVEPVAVDQPVSREEFDNLVNRLSVIEKSLGIMGGQMEERGQFEEIATEAIRMLAKNSTSNFVASAKSKVGEEPKGSIFQQAKAKVDSLKGK